MIVLFLLIPLSVLIAGVFLGVFIWAVRSGQFEDTCTPALRVLSEDRSLPIGKPASGQNANFTKPMAKDAKRSKTS